MPETTDQNKPFLRALKCAYKLHKAGLSEYETTAYLIECTSKRDLPSASTPAEDLLPASFNFDCTVNGADYWQDVQDRVFNKAGKA